MRFGPPFDTVWRKPWDVFSVFVWYPRLVEIRSVRGSNNRHADYSVGMWWLTWEIVIRRIWQLGYDCRRLSWQRQSGAFTWSRMRDLLPTRRWCHESRQFHRVNVSGLNWVLMVKDVRCADDLKLLAWNSNTLLANFYSSPSDREKTGLPGRYCRIPFTDRHSKEQESWYHSYKPATTCLTKCQRYREEVTCTVQSRTEAKKVKVKVV